MFPRIRVPAVVVEIVLVIVIGPSVLGWAETDEVVHVLVPVGLAFLLFLGGLELDPRPAGPAPSPGRNRVRAATGRVDDPGIVHRRRARDRGIVVAGLLQATSLPCIVTAGQIGAAIGALDASTAAAFVAAGLVSALAFPTIALSVLQRSSTAVADLGPAEREMIVS